MSLSELECSRRRVVRLREVAGLGGPLLLDLRDNKGLHTSSLDRLSDANKSREFEEFAAQPSK
jgi:hypothetical protein